MSKELTQMILEEPLQFLEFGAVRYPPGGRCGPRPQAVHQLVLLTQGRADIYVGRESYVLLPGHVALQRPAREEFFQFSRTAETRHSWLLFSIRDGVPLRDALDRAPRVLPMPPRLVNLVDEGDRLGCGAGPFTAALRLQLARAVLLEYMRCVYEGPDPARQHPQAVLRALDHMERNYGTIRGLEELCTAAHVTPGHLIRLFRRHVGATPAAYLWGMRIQRATQLIVSSGLPMTEVASQTGFQSSSHLSRAIKERHGVSPRTVRAQAQASMTPGQGNPRRGQLAPLR